MAKRVSKQTVMRYATTNDIEVEVEGRTGRGCRHVHAYAPHGKVFVGSGCTNTGCGNFEIGEPIDWAHVLSEIKVRERDPDIDGPEDLDDEDECIASAPADRERHVIARA